MVALYTCNHALVSGLWLLLVLNRRLRHHVLGDLDS